MRSINHRTSTFVVVDFLSRRSRLAFLPKAQSRGHRCSTVAGVIIYTRDWQLLRRFKFVGGILLTLVVVALWGIPALIQTHGEFFTVGIGRHVVGRSFMTTGRSRREFLRHVRAAIAVLFCHGLHQFLSVVDQVAVVDSEIVAEQRSRSRRPGYSGIRLTLICSSGIAIIFVIFTLVSTKLPHYTLPALSVACAFARAALASRSGG